MNRLLALLICVLVCGCGDPSAKAPMLTLKIVRDNGASHSIGRHRVFTTGILSESGDSGGNGQGVTQRVTVEKIVDNGVRLSFEFSDASGERFSKQIFVGYDQETTVDLPNQSTLVATLRAHE